MAGSGLLGLIPGHGLKGGLREGPRDQLALHLGFNTLSRAEEQPLWPVQTPCPGTWTRSLGKILSGHSH